jgi:hypothetical protein
MTTDPDLDPDPESARPEPAAMPSKIAAPSEPPVLPKTSRDDQDLGWGDRPNSDDRDDDWYRRERPPHHG